jgi:hypothetical protein
VDYRNAQTESMPIAHWWPQLRPQTRDWLIANNGDVVPPDIMLEIADAGGPGSSDSWWVAADEDATGSVMPDEAIDWIEETANEESADES